MLLRRRVTKITKSSLTAQQRSLHDCKMLKKLRKLGDILCFQAFFCVCLPKSWNLKPTKHTKFFETGVLVWKSKNMKPNRSIFFFILVAICLNAKDELMCLTFSVNLNGKSCRQYMQEGRRKIEATGPTRYRST